MPRSRFFITRFCGRFGGRNAVGSSNILSNPSGLNGDVGPWEFQPWEFPLVLAMVLFLISLHGSGPWSIDRLLQRWYRQVNNDLSP
jgi:hypothetical protein